MRDYLRDQDGTSSSNSRSSNSRSSRQSEESKSLNNSGSNE